MPLSPRVVEDPASPDLALEEELTPEEEAALADEEAAAEADAAAEEDLAVNDPAALDPAGGGLPLDPSGVDQDPGQQAALIGLMIREQAEQAKAQIDQEAAAAAQQMGQLIVDAAANPATLDGPGLPV